MVTIARDLRGIKSRVMRVRVCRLGVLAKLIERAAVISCISCKVCTSKVGARSVITGSTELCLGMSLVMIMGGLSIDTRPALPVHCIRVLIAISPTTLTRVTRFTRIHPLLLATILSVLHQPIT